MKKLDRQQSDFRGNVKHLEILLDALEQERIRIWNEWRMDHGNELPDLQGVNLIEGNLMGIDLSGADLSDANLSKANLSTGELSGIVLVRATLIETRFIHARIYGGGLGKANLRNADLNGAVLNSATLSQATLTGAKIHGMSYNDWNIKGVKCDYVFIDNDGKRRMPEGRDFEPDEFERLYRYYPTIDLEFKEGLDGLTILIADYAAVQLNKENDEFDFRIKEISSYGACPVIKVAVKTKEQIQAGKAILTERISQYEKQIEDKNWAINKLMELALKSDHKPQISFHGPTNIDRSMIGDNPAEQNIQTYNITFGQIEEIDHQIESSDLQEEDKSFGRELLSELKRTASLEAKNKLIEWAKMLTEKGLEQIPTLVRIPTDSATSFRLIPPPCSDPIRHRIPKHCATPEEC